MKTKVPEAGAEVLQGEPPLRSIHAHLCGFHFYNGDMKRQVREGSSIRTSWRCGMRLWM